ncbi:MAG: hypothetical protein GY757_19090 [bacterium]|nr:hypothetical protein [bacterium]
MKKINMLEEWRNLDSVFYVVECPCCGERQSIVVPISEQDAAFDRVCSRKVCGQYFKVYRDFPIPETAPNQVTTSFFAITFFIGRGSDNPKFREKFLETFGREYPKGKTLGWWSEFIYGQMEGGNNGGER